MPFIAVDIASAGVVVGFVTDTVTPFAVPPDTFVTVPPDVGLIYFSPLATEGSAAMICPLDQAGRRVYATQVCTKISHFVFNALRFRTL